ncbi:MAG: hypothetical protein JWQ34_3825 [Mucilaginibacter sp.]|nr:hypothetical protein [Mucilaginibacter sp.]
MLRFGNSFFALGGSYNNSPFFPPSPYSAVAVWSFNTSMLAISSCLILERLMVPGFCRTPSITYKGGFELENLNLIKLSASVLLGS